MVCLEIVELLPSRVMNGPQMPSMSLFLYGRVPRLMTRHLIQSNLDFWRAIMWKIIKNKKFYYESSIYDFFVNPLSSYGTFVCITFGLCKKKNGGGHPSYLWILDEHWQIINNSYKIFLSTDNGLGMVNQTKDIECGRIIKGLVHGKDHLHHYISSQIWKWSTHHLLGWSHPFTRLQRNLTLVDKLEKKFISYAFIASHIWFVYKNNHDQWTKFHVSKLFLYFHLCQET